MNQPGLDDEELTGELMKIIIDLRQDAKNNKDWDVSDKIRLELNKLGVTIKDRKDGVDWEISPYDPPRGSC